MDLSCLMGARASLRSGFASLDPARASPKVAFTSFGGARVTLGVVALCVGYAPASFIHSRSRLRAVVPRLRDASAWFPREGERRERRGREG